MNHHHVESLEQRALLTATLSAGTLTITGTDAAETIAVNLAGGGTQITAAVGAEVTPFDAALVQRLVINALDGADTINVNVNRPSNVHGNQGNDTMNGGDGDDTFDGDQGADTFNGNGGNDTNVWDPGDGSDVFNGGVGGFDTLLFNGSNQNEVMAANPTTGDRFNFTRDLGSITIDNGNVEHIVVPALGGNDQVTMANNLSVAGVLATEVDGGAGDDTLNGSNLYDVLTGGLGNDTIDGNGGSDVMAGGDNDDLLIWDPGDGNDLDIGGNGNDTLLFNGNNGDEVFTLTNATIGRTPRVFATRSAGNILLDVRTTETIDIEAKGGTDRIVVNNLVGTGVTSIIANGGDGAGDVLDLTNAGAATQSIVASVGNESILS
jgi:Ca2+-binding RTX toxin-like protein